MKTESRTGRPVAQVESPRRHLPLVDLLVDTKTELLELAVRSGLRVFTAMLEEDRTAICGPRLCPPAGPSGQPGRDGPERNCARGPEGATPPAARTERRR